MRALFWLSASIAGSKIGKESARSAMPSGERIPQTVCSRARAAARKSACMGVIMLWIAALAAGISTANSSYSVFGALFVHALGVEAMDIKVTGSDKADWTPQSETETIWEQATSSPYVVDIPKPERMLIQGTTLWSSVAVKNVSPTVSVSIRVSIRDIYDTSVSTSPNSSVPNRAARATPNLFPVSRFSLRCEGVPLISEVSGADIQQLSDIAIPGILQAGAFSLCQVGVTLDDVAFDDDFAMTADSRVIPQLFFEGEQQ